MGWPDGVFVDGSRTGQKLQNDSMMFRNNILAGNLRAVNNSSASGARTKIYLSNNDSVLSSAGVLNAPFNYSSPDFTPASGSIALTGANFTGDRINDPFFIPTSYRGALSNNPDSNWTNCWSSFDPQNENYNSAPYNKPGALAGFTFQNTSGRSVTFTNNSSNASSYFWNFGVGNTTSDTSVSASPTFIFPANGTYTVTLIARSACGNSVETKTVVINDASSNPVADFTFVQSSTTGSREFTFTNTTDEKGFATTYLWDFGVAASTTDTSTAKNPVFNFPANGTYTVTLYAFGSAGADTVAKNIQVIATNVKEETASINNISMYPNPTANEVTISFDLNKQETVSVNIYDMSGKLVKTIPVQQLTQGSYDLTIETTELNSGVYFTNISTAQFNKTYRLVIIK